MIVLNGGVGSRVGELQQLEIRRVADGPQHGLRAGSEEDQGEHPQPGSYLHYVRLLLSPFLVFTVQDHDQSPPLSFTDAVHPPATRLREPTKRTCKLRAA